jgi:hypothetical protein
MTRRRAAAWGVFLLALFCAGCGGGGGMGLDFNSAGPGWGTFNSGKMFGAPL